MKNMMIVGAAALAVAAVSPSASSAELIECAADAPAAKSGHWYYRIIEGRKCWYQGKAMLPKEQLYWAKSSEASAREAKVTPRVRAEEPIVEREITGPQTDERQADGRQTDGRNSAPAPMTEGRAWPAPAASEISFESRWLGLTSGWR